MEGIALAIKGFEDICAKEIEEIIKVKASIKEYLVTFEAKDYYDFVRLCYVSQSASKVGMLLLEKKFKSIDQLSKEIQKLDLSFLANFPILFAAKSFIKNNDMDSSHLSAEIGGALVENFTSNKQEYKVNLDNPKMIFYAILIGENFYLMLDFSGLDLGKRDYKLFQSPFSLRGNVAYSLVRFANLKRDDTALDLFSGCGSIMIEAAISLSKKPVQFYRKDLMSFIDFKFLEKEKIDRILEEYDKKAEDDVSLSIFSLDANFNNISNAKKNAKAAEVHKVITFSRISVDWLDTKFGKGKVDKIITYLPSPSKLRSDKDTEKIYKDFFYQGGYILSKDCRCVLLVDKPELFLNIMEKERFELGSRREIMQGDKEMAVLVVKKKK